MRAVVQSGPGGPEVLRVASVPNPAPEAGEVMVRVVATAVNRADTSQRRGLYPPPPGAPEYLGLECAGVVVDVGAGVERWAVGDEVCALLGGGGYAELVTIHQDHVLPRPAPVGLAEAAGLAETACTVVANLTGPNGLHPGETLLVHGGGSGIGTTAIQWARARGCSVLTTVGSQWKAEACEGLGADVAIDYTRENFVDVVRDRTDGRGVDVILDIVGSDYLPANLEALAPFGRLHQVGVQTGSTATIDLRLMMAKRLVLTGSTLRSRSIPEKAAVVATVRQELWPYYDSGQMVPVIDSRFALEDVAAAHRHLESSAHFGKVLLNVGDH